MLTSRRIENHPDEDETRVIQPVGADGQPLLNTRELVAHRNRGRFDICYTEGESFPAYHRSFEDVYFQLPRSDCLRTRGYGR